MSTSTANQPAAQAPPGQTNNLVNPPSQAYWIIITVTICLTAATLMTWMRIHVSAFVTKRFKWDDGLIVFAWLMFIAYSIIALELIPHGAMIDAWNISVADAMALSRLGWIEAMVYPFQLFFVKLVVLVLYKRIFIPSHAKRTWTCYAILGVILFNAMFYTADLFVEAFNCIPTEKIWDSNIEGHCVNTHAVIVSTAVLNVVSNVFMLSIPISIVWHLGIPRKRRTELLFVFGFSILYLVASICRLVYSCLGARDSNRSMTLPKIDLWTLAEIACCFITACIPMIPRFIQYIRGKTDASTSRHTHIFSSNRASKDSEQMAKASTRRSGLSTILRSSYRHSHAEEEEDPYLVMNNPLSSADTLVEKKGGRPTRSSAATGITVERTLDISSVPQAHLKEESVNPDWS